jgi:hypothetical protein
LRIALRHCGVRKSTPHFSGLARLVCGLFAKPFDDQDFLKILSERQAAEMKAFYG